MRFLVDAQLPPALVKHLEAAGHQAEHVNRIGLGSSSDLDVWRHACATGSTLITKDVDFLALAKTDPTSPPVVWVRLGNATNVALTRAFDVVLTDLLRAFEAGERVVEVR